MPIAFKEWAVTVRALAEGEQLITLRKGGIREPGKPFRLAHERFFLYPTFDHQPGEFVRESHQPELRRALEEGVWSDGEPPLHAFATGGIQQPDRVRIRAWAEVAGHFTIADPRCVDALSPFYVWTTDYAEKRLGWRRHQPLHVLLLRTYRIPRPVTVKVKDEYSAAQAWVELQRELPFEGTPVLSDAEFERASEEIAEITRGAVSAGPRLGLGLLPGQGFAGRLGSRLRDEDVAAAGDQEVRNIGARRPALHAGDSLLDQQPLDHLRLGAVLRAGDLHELAFAVLRLDLARLPLTLAQRRLSAAGHMYERHSTGPTEALVRWVFLSTRWAEEAIGVHQPTSSATSRTFPSSIR